jgi:mannose-1-phosphate guanylyltransferase
MLQHTWDRADQLSHPFCKATVVYKPQLAEVCSQFAGRAPGILISQPHPRNTIASLFLSLTYVRAQDPKAIVIVHPSDQFVFPEKRFIEIVQRAIRAADWVKNRIMILSSLPTNMEADYGWIQPGARIGLVSGSPIFEVESLLDNPDESKAQEAMALGALWNSLVLVARLEVFWNLGWLCFPSIMNLFEKLQAAIESPQEAPILQSIFKLMPHQRDNSDFLCQIPHRHIGMMHLDRVLWNSWNRPDQIIETLSRIGKTPTFPVKYNWLASAKVN